jgi:hypothetical protein
LQSANLQQVNLDIQGNSLYLAVNGEALPVISWNVDALDTVQQVVGALVAVSPELLGTVLELLQTTDIGLQVGLPPAQGAVVVVVPADFDVTQIQFQAPDLGDIAPPVVQLVLNYEGGRLVEAGGIPAEVLALASVYLRIYSLSNTQKHTHTHTHNTHSTHARTHAHKKAH